MLPDSKVVDAPPHKVSIDQTVAMAGDFEFLVLFTSTPGFDVDVKIAERMQDTNPKLKIAFVGPPVTVEPEKVLRASSGHRFRGAARVRPPGRRISPTASRSPNSPGVSYRTNGGFVHNPDGPAIENLDAAALGDQGLQARSRHHPLQRPVPAAPVPGVLHLARAARRCAPSACGRRRIRATAGGRRSAGDVANEVRYALGDLPRPARDLLRRRHLQLPEGAHPRAVQGN